MVVLYGETVSLSDKVNKLVESVGPASFGLTKEITVTCEITFARGRHLQMPQDNIKLITKQVFFNPAVKEYKKEDTIKTLVIVSWTPAARLRRLTSLQDRVQHSAGIPKNLKEVNPQAWVQIESKVGNEVTQLRGAIKKVVSLVPGCSLVWSITDRALAKGRFAAAPQGPNEDRHPHQSCRQKRRKRY